MFTGQNDTSGSGGGSGGGPGFLDSVANAAASAATGNMAGVANEVIGLFGPSYDSANGGEVIRQLQGLGNYQGEKLMWDSYCHFLQTNCPGLWQSGNIWDVSTLAQGHPSRYRDRYLAVMAGHGLQMGTFVLNVQGEPVPYTGAGPNASNVPPQGGSQGNGQKNLTVDGPVIPWWMVILGLAVVAIMYLWDSPKGSRSKSSTSKTKAL